MSSVGNIAPLEKKKRFWGRVLLLPLLLGLFVFFFIPLGQSFFYSFTDLGNFGLWTTTTLENYQRLVVDPDLKQALYNTAFYTIVGTPVIVAASLALAVGLNSQVRGVGIYRTLLFLPAVTMSASVAMVWKWIFNIDFGLLNQLLARFGQPPQAWLSDPAIVRFSLMAVIVWSSIALKMIILLAALQGVPKHTVEAAYVDGAGPFRRFFSITLPMMTPTLFFISIMTMIELLQIFDLIFIMISPGSLVTTDAMSVVYLFYRHAFDYQEKGYASAIAVLLFSVTMLLTMMQLKLGKYLTRWQER